MLKSKTYKLEEVFGSSREIPLTYIRRSYVDDSLFESLERNHHIVIYGSSKQGKTCLRKKCVDDSDFISVHCSNRIDIRELNSLILKRAGYDLTLSENITSSGKAKVKATIGLKFLGIEPEIEGGTQKELLKQPIEIDLEDVNDVINALKSIHFNKLIVLDDFHYLKPDTQKDFAFQLKAFYENSKYTFVIVGVWLEQNRLISLNGDLAGRVDSINADEWKESDLLEVINVGESLLNITFSKEIKDRIIEESYDNVFFVQEICYRICSFYRIKQTEPNNFFIGNANLSTNAALSIENTGLHISSIVKEIANQHTARYHSFLIQLVDGFRENPDEMYKWILFSLLCVSTDELQKSLRYVRIKELIAVKHPLREDLNTNNLSRALKSLTPLQIKKGISPNILDYDENDLVLSVVDKGFLIWLNFQDKKSLFEMVGLKDYCDVLSYN